MKKVFLFFMLTLIVFPAFSEMAIKGTVLDSGTKTPLEFVNVVLFKQGSKNTVAGVTSDKVGNFFIPAVENGKYTLRISFIGYNTLEQPILVTGKQMNIGVFNLSQNAKNLKGVEVVGQAPQMHFDVDKKVFDVSQNISAAGGSASDVLKNIPSVTVDNQGNIALRNDGNVQVWINGKASGLTADNRAQVLQQIPADNIKSIEIMDNPSAKYSPEGSAGIINIVMKENHKAGYYGSVSAGLSYPDGGKLGQNIGASINYTSSKIDTYANLGYRAMSFDGGGNTNRYNYTGNDTTFLKSNNNMVTAFSGLFMRAGADYHFDSKNTLGFSGFGMVGSGIQTTNTNYLLSNDMFNSNTLLRNYSQNNSGSGTRPSMNVNFDFHHDFDKNGSNIIGGVSYSNHNRTGNNTYNQTDSLTNARSSINQLTDSKNTELEFKVDYTGKLTKDSKLEAGWQSDFSNRLSSTSGFDNIKNIDIPTYFDNFNYNEQIHAGYVTYGSKIDKFTFQLGMRGELFLKQSTNTSKIGNTESDTAQFIPQKSFFHVFPSFFLSYSLPNNAELQFNYSNRVNRPRGRQINPFKDYSDSTNISFGNPDLSPQYSTALELNFIKTWDAQTLSSSVYYHNTDNVIQNVRFLDNGVMQSTYANVTKSQNAGLELISKNRLFNFLDLTSTVNVYYSQLDSSTYINPYNSAIRIPIPGQTNLSWTANVMANFMLGRTFSGQITGEYNSPQLIAQGTRNAGYSIDLGVRKTFLDRKLSLSFNVRDLLNSDRNFQTTSGIGFKQTTSSYFHGRMAMLTLSYSFGNMKPKPGDMKKQQGSTSTDMMDTGE